MTHNRS